MSVLRRLSSSQLVRGSLLVFLGNNVANFGNFLYNLLMGRLLGPEKYGELGAILSIFVILGVPLTILNLLVVKIISSYWGKKDKGAIDSLLKYLTAKVFFIGVLASLAIILLSPLISAFLKIDSLLPIVIISASFALSGPSAVNRSVIQGTLSFSYLSLNNILQSFLKLAFSTLLVYLNFALIGALLGPLLSGIAVYLLTFLQIRLILGGAEKSARKSLDIKLKSTFIPILFATLSLTAFVTIDVLWVRHFFSGQIAGEYVALTTVSKIILYGVGPVLSVMFPLISNRASSGLSYILPLLSTLVISLGISSFVIVSFFLFPKLVVGILYGESYFGVIPLLGLFSFFIAVHTINTILTSFILSISYYKPVLYLVFASFFQSVLIFLFHQKIENIIWSNIFSSLLYLSIISYYVIKKEFSGIKRVMIKAISYSLP